MPTSRLVIVFVQYDAIDNTFIKKDIASSGGHASSGSFKPGDERAKEAGRKGGQTTGQPDD
jgi:general stress protein YciG